MLASCAFALWLVALSLQLADLGTARFDSRRLARGARTVVRLHPVAWVIPVAAAAVVGLGFGLDSATTLARQGDTVAAALLGAVLSTGLVAAWLVVTVAVTRPAADSYRAIRDELLEHSGTRVQQEWLDDLRIRLNQIDLDSERSKPPVAVSARSAGSWVFRRPQRLLPPLAGVLLLVTVSMAVMSDGSSGWLVLAAAVSALLSAALAVAGARASLTLISAVREAQIEHRAELVHLLTEAERSAKKPVAGLGDRVARALQILREQQG